MSSLVIPETKSTKNRAMQDVSTWIEYDTLTIPLDRIGPGVWRVTFEGLTDEDQRWHSEPIEITLPVERKAG